MTLHRLTAGAGYRYLLRHIATGDCARTGRAPVTSYYTESGNPPGRWFGRGLDRLGAARSDLEPIGLEVGTVVVEDAMGRLFAHGLDPMTGVPLGRAYPSATSPADRVAAQTRKLPEAMDAQAREAAIEAITRVELGREANPAVAGFDLTFTVMKSVSTLWALGDVRVQQAVYDAHIAAVAAALRFVEDRALFTRTGHGGCRQEATRGAVAAAFDHWDSRAGDPNLHTHVVVANKVQGLDGTWRSLDSRALHHAVVAVSELYEAFLVDEVAGRLPVRWGWRGRGPRRSPAFELEGVGEELLSVFSRRATQIDEAMTRAVARFAAGHGRGPNRIEIIQLRQMVTRATRPAKKVHPLAQLLQRWRDRATRTTGMSPEQLTEQVLRGAGFRPARCRDLSATVVDELATRVLEGVRERRSTWTRWNVEAEALRLTKPLIAASVAERVAITAAIAEAVLGRCVSLEAPAAFTSTGRYARADGTSVFDRPSEHTYTDAVILQAEDDLLEASTDITAPTARVLHADLNRGDGEQLAEDQEAAVRQIAASGRAVDLLVGPAGSGKTTALAALRAVWERQHGRGSVIGLAPSSSAAANLAGALGVLCENTAKWLHESTGPGGKQRRAVIDQLVHERRGTGIDLIRARTIDTATAALIGEDRRWRLQGGQLVIVDEASLAGTLALRDLTAQARRAGAKVLLVGDHAQLSAVDAGGAFALLVDRTGGARLRTLWRFTHPWEAAATAGLRAGDRRALDAYEDAGRVHAGPGESMLEEAYAAWSADVAAGAAAILLAPDAGTVTALNSRAHNDRVLDGLVRPGGITTASGTVIGVGDRVVTRLNERHLRVGGGYVRNGDLWDVRGIDPDGSLLVVRAHTRLARRGVVGMTGSDEHALVHLPAGYAYEHVDLAYATTTHRAQGITVDAAHVLAHTGMTRENLYVAMTRGRDTNHLYLAVDGIDNDCDGPPDPHAPGDARDILTTILGTSGAERSATATIAARLDEASSLRRLEPIARTLHADAAHTRLATRLTAHGIEAASARAIMTSPDAGRLATTLDQIAATADNPAATITRILHTGQAPASPDALLGRAAAWLRRHHQDAAEIRPVRDPDGLDADGLTLLDQIEHLITDRTAVLTRAAIEDAPMWLDELGPAPAPGPAREAWLAAIGAHATHLDRRTPAAPATRPATPTPAR
ncbi:MobF family relaxase [Cellulomonas soli]|nr:MobF family relaxase [Cellulomonas soli]NYI60298.1 conjugative relaxase-like TrwC/TraI family protein [Cellulomonas soli]